MNVHLVTAGLGSQRWRFAAQRLARQASRSGWFASIQALDTQGLRFSCPQFFRDNASFIRANSRGYGYWLWRPYLILQKLQEMHANEILLFLDAGCELNVNADSHSRFLQYICRARDSQICLMRTPFRLTQWCKGDLLSEFGIQECSELRTVEPGVLFMTKSRRNIELLEEWIKWGRKQNYHYLDDSPSHLPNFAEFHEHRHDQAILTLLLSDSPEVALEQETFFPNHSWRTAGQASPIWVTRNSHPFLHESEGLPAQMYRLIRNILKGH